MQDSLLVCVPTIVNLETKKEGRGCSSFLIVKLQESLICSNEQTERLTLQADARCVDMCFSAGNPEIEAINANNRITIEKSLLIFEEYT